MKRFVCFVLLAVLLVGGAMGSMALHEGANSPELGRVLDGAELLTDREENSLEKRISKIGEKYAFDVLIITVNSDVGDVEPYSEDVYDTHGYGYGEDFDGILIIVSTFSRDVLVSTTGYGEIAFTDYGRDVIIRRITGMLSEGDYSGAFDKFVKLTDKFLEKAQKGQPYDYNEKYYTASSWFARIAIGVVIGCIVGAIVVGVQKAGMKTAVPRKNAAEYMVPGSLVMTTGKDLFIPSIVTKTPKAPPPSQGGSGGRGGSTSHSSSSGRSHSSSRGKF